MEMDAYADGPTLIGIKFFEFVTARVVKLANTRDLKSLGERSLCRFESGLGHMKDEK